MVLAALIIRVNPRALNPSWSTAISINFFDSGHNEQNCFICLPDMCALQDIPAPENLSFWMALARLTLSLIELDDSPGFLPSRSLNARKDFDMDVYPVEQGPGNLGTVLAYLHLAARHAGGDADRYPQGHGL